MPRNFKTTLHFQVDSLADEFRDAGSLLAGMVGRTVDAVDDALIKVNDYFSNKPRKKLSLI